MSVDQVTGRGPGRRWPGPNAPGHGEPGREVETAELDQLRQQVRRQAGELERLRRRLSQLQRDIREHGDRTGAGRYLAGEGA
jgi:hypothetical protein